MRKDTLDIFLPSFLVVFLVITFCWQWFRKWTRLEEYRDIEKLMSYKRLRRINHIYMIVFLLFGAMAIVYTAFPNVYYVFMPLDKFDHPLINATGVLLLKIALVWVTVAQLLIDRALYKYSREIGNLSLMELVHFSERLLLGGLTLMFVGMFVTITNVVGIAAGLVTVLLYYRMILRFKTS